MITCPNCRQPNLPGSRLCSQCGASFTGAQGLQHPPPQAPVQPQHPTASSGILPIGHVINNMYRIDGILGEGGMGIVYRATEIASQQPVVVKAIRPEFTDREDFRARILDEGRVVAKIDHQNVVQMRAVFAHESNIFLVLQFVDGESLDKTLARYVEHRKFMPLENVMAIFDQILQGVGAAHEEGVIHRDIKPGNILLQSKNAKAKVTDFGIAKAQYDQRAATKMTMGIIGSPHYISPEQINAVADIDARTDIYSLGIMLFEMLAGRVPFDAPTQYAMMTHHLTSPIPSIRNIRPDVPEHIENVICRACAKDRTQRYASTKEMARAIQYGEAMLRDKTIAGKPVHISGMGPPITDGGAGVAPPPLQPPVFAHPPSGPFQQTPQPVEPFHQQIQQTPQPIQPTPQPQPPYQPHQPPQQPVLHTPQP
ncbi:MAG: serine/threonine protein kinase, partial [Polyangiaceae bacterium]|nr:serine/threonine protein kinase [Polyangiaceae bacterium]